MNNAESVMDSIRRVERATGRRLNMIHHLPRAGDIHRLVLDSGKFSKEFGWKMEAGIDSIVEELLCAG